MLLANTCNTDDREAMDRYLASLTIDSIVVEPFESVIPARLKKYLYINKPRSVQEIIDNSNLRSTLADVIKKYGHFDVIHVERLMMSELFRAGLKNKGNTKYILDLDDWESKMRFRELQQHGSPHRFQRWKQSHEPRVLRAYENHFLPQYDRVYVCSEGDRLELQESLGINNVVVAPNGYNMPALGDFNTEAGLESKTLFYVGALNYGPNFNALRYFIEDIFSLVLKSVPDARLCVVGGGEKGRIKAYNHPSVDVMGFVDDLVPYYEKATVSIVPLLAGGGTRVKILEAASFKKPVISTAIGCEGLEFTDKESIMVADSPSDFASACVELLSNPQVNRAMGNAACKVVEERYQWKSIGERIRKHLD